MISIIIPTYNEAPQIKAILRALWERDTARLVQQIIVSDGGSTDGTVEEASSENVQVVLSPQKGRAAQMNYGAEQTTQPVLYFLHADTLPPYGFTQDIAQAVQKGFSAGCFRLQFDVDHWFLKANCWFTRFDVDAIRFGDQSLFVTRPIFSQLGGFDESLWVMEDQELIKRLKKRVRFCILKKAVVTSARKYLDNGIYKTQAIFFVIYFLYRWGCSQNRLVATYRRLIRQNKV